MSVYTQLTDQQFSDFCQQFGVDFAKAIPITQGIKNSNWFIETTTDEAGEPSAVAVRNDDNLAPVCKKRGANAFFRSLALAVELCIEALKLSRIADRCQSYHLIISPPEFCARIIAYFFQNVNYFLLMMST